VFRQSSALDHLQSLGPTLFQTYFSEGLICIAARTYFRWERRAKGARNHLGVRFCSGALFINSHGGINR
jgi:hypothetical protein